MFRERLCVTLINVDYGNKVLYKMSAISKKKCNDELGISRLTP